MKSCVGAGGAIERFDVGRELDQVAGDEPRGQAEIAQDLHQQPGRVAARSGAFGERLFAGLHARLHADHVADVLLQPSVQLDQEVDGTARVARDRRQYPASAGPGVGATK